MRSLSRYIGLPSSLTNTILSTYGHLFESNDLKATGTGVYQEVFDTLDYDNVSGADLVDTLLDGMESVGYTV